MGTHISDKLGKPRKRHLCRVCGTTIAAGEQCHIYKGVERGEGFYTLYFHNECWDYSRDWDDLDWETCGPGAISREEIRAEMSGGAFCRPLDCIVSCNFGGNHGLQT